MDQPIRTNVTTGGKEDNLMKLEAIKTMTWHKKPLQACMEELGYSSI